MTHRVNQASLKVMTTLAKGQSGMTLIPDSVLGGGAAALLAVTLLGVLLLIMFKTSPRPLAEQLDLARLASIGLVVIGGIGTFLLFVGGVLMGW